MPRLIWGIVVAAAVTGALAGCGSSPDAGSASSSGGATAGPASSGTSATATATATAPGTGSPGSPGAPGAPGAAAGSPHCTSGMLGASLTDLGTAAGNRYATLVLTNRSGKNCTTGGWSGLQLSGADGTVPTKVVREGAARTITVGNGGRAYERLHWAVVPAGDEPDDAGCEPEPSALKVIAPNDTEQITANWTYGAVCQHGRIRLQPLTTNPEPR
ncbi:DUF4232 domain-containing protein [Actinomadura sp. GTD37]|uniref:DUF4232 domain-containing protein n=1 Tax=Actinomadura sp. GTD37 TaxID=1778030 RepID=UPI0035C1F265